MCCLSATVGNVPLGDPRLLGEDPIENPNRKLALCPFISVFMVVMTRFLNDRVINLV